MPTSLPGTRPTGDDQQWKREVIATLQSLIAENESQQSQIDQLRGQA